VTRKQIESKLQKQCSVDTNNYIPDKVKNMKTTGTSSVSETGKRKNTGFYLTEQRKVQVLNEQENNTYKRQGSSEKTDKMENSNRN
jgi:hypothetical protein